MQTKSNCDDPPSKGEILVVDDTPEALALLGEVLRQAGYTVRLAPNGDLALWTAVASPPDIVLLDVRMPGIDGFEVCRRLKSEPATMNLPIIFVSAQDDTDNKKNGFHAGAVDYIAKPFDCDEVLQRVSTHIKLARLAKELQNEKSLLEAKVRERTVELEGALARVQLENEARARAEELLRISACSFDASLNGIFITDGEGHIVATNRSFTSLMGYLPEECLGQNPRMFKSGKHGQRFYEDMWHELMTVGHWSGEVWNRRKDGNVFPCLQEVSSVKGSAGEPLYFVSVLLDLSALKDSQTLVDFLTRHDSLTGLPNRVIVHDRFQQISATLDDPKEALAVLSINLDKFRFINDFHGHALGDQILQWVSLRMSECLRTTDTMFREGGDQFIVVHRDRNGPAGVRLVAEALLAALAGDLTISDTSLSISASIGVALFPTDGQTLESLTNNAMIAMARAKKQGGEDYAFFTENLDQGVRARFDIAQRLRHALDRGEFEVHYQPQVDGRCGCIVAAEALLRWKDPNMGFVAPSQFIPIAEETGRIIEIGEWVLNTVCAQIATWNNQGHGYIKVAVNLSARQFMRNDLCQQVRSALANNNIPANCLELEITESAIVEEVQRAVVTLRELKDIGVAISLDDFGTGYSSLSYLKQFPIDCLKIDQSFVRDLKTDADDEAIVLSIINLAHNMRMKVVAEGVEHSDQHKYLTNNGCDVLQGYLFGKPMSAAAFIALIRSSCEVGDCLEARHA